MKTNTSDARAFPSVARIAFASFTLLSVCFVASAASPARPAVSSAAPGPLSALEHGLRPTTLKAGEALPGWSLQERMAYHRVPGVAIAVLKDGVVIQAAGFGLREAGTQEAVDADTAFSVGSVSKIITAATTLRLVAGGTLGLDQDIGAHLKSWRIPVAPAFADATVTPRMLMSHTAGLNVHGFKDYLPGEPLPSILETLSGIPPAKNEPVEMRWAPGTRMRYSGGGVTVEQLLIEEATGRKLAAVARAEVFQPLGMGRSSFDNPLPAAFGNIAKAHDDKGAPAALPRGWESFPEQGASGLWTSAHDLGAFVGALIHSYQGKDGFLPQAIAVQMMTEVGPSIHGLGPRLGGAGAMRYFHHGGANDSYRAWIEGHLQTGDGMVILTNGHNGGRLLMEIRNALNDAMDPGFNPPLRTLDLDLSAPAYADYGGTWVMDAVPQDLQGNLAGYYESGEIEVRIVDGVLAVAEKGGDDETLSPLTPSRFVSPGDQDQLQFEFHRDARGALSRMTVDRGNARLYFRPQKAAQR